MNGARPACFRLRICTGLGSVMDDSGRANLIARGRAAWHRFFYPSRTDFVDDDTCELKGEVTLALADCLREALDELVVVGVSLSGAREELADTEHAHSEDWLVIETQVARAEKAEAEREDAFMHIESWKCRADAIAAERDFAMEMLNVADGVNDRLKEALHPFAAVWQYDDVARHFPEAIYLLNGVRLHLIADDLRRAYDALAALRPSETGPGRPNQ